MIYNSFNRVLTSKECCCHQDQPKKEIKEITNDIKVIDNNDWESKYDISIVVLQEEYLQCISRVKNVDEKANKYLLVISIIATGMFVVLSSSAIEGLNFNYSNMSLSLHISWIFLINSIVGLWFGIITIRALLECLNLVEINRMPDVAIALQSSETDNSSQYKDHLISCYQEAVNMISQTVINKQKHLRIVSKNIKWFISSLACSFIILTILRILG